MEMANIFTDGGREIDYRTGCKRLPIQLKRWGECEMKNRIHSEENAYMEGREELDHSGRTPVEPKALSRRKLLASLGMAGVAMAVTGSLGAANERGRPTWQGNPGLPGDVQVLNEWNETAIRKVNSISELIQQSGMFDGQIFQVISYHDGMYKGGDLFIWSTALDKSLHDGGYYIDPTIPIPSFATFHTYYTAQNTGAGVFVRLNNQHEVNADQYGLVKATDDASFVWACAAIQAAINKASVSSTTDYYCKEVKINKGKYFSTNPIILSTNGSFSARMPALIGGDGNNIYDVEICKTTTNTVGAGYFGGDVDAVIFVSPTTARGDYVFGEHTSGFTLTRTIADVGYGYYAKNSAMAYRGNIQAIGHGYGIYTDDCWMSKLGFLRTYQGLKGIAVRGGTSNYGGQLYVDGAKERGFDFYSLTYSNLFCACDGVGGNLADGGVAYDFSFSKSVGGVFSMERHKGQEFYFHYSDGITISGRSYHATPVSNSSYKVFANGGSTVTFENFNWKETYGNSTMTAAEIAKYTFTNKANYVTVFDFDNCIMNENFAASGYVAQLDIKFAGNVLDAGYSNHCGLVTHILSLNHSTFKRLCYVGKTASIELLSANSMSATYNRYYANPFVLTEGTPSTIANPRPNRVLKNSISTDSNSPTNLYTLYDNDVAASAYLQGYVDSSGWLWVKPSTTGNNLDYKFIIST
ncbi:hypothetical protein [Paenibacillus oceani]|nr:hypothetical protein [Paenibacillus oceani]